MKESIREILKENTGPRYRLMARILEEIGGLSVDLTIITVNGYVSSKMGVHGRYISTEDLERLPVCPAEEAIEILRKNFKLVLGDYYKEEEFPEKYFLNNGIALHFETSKTYLQFIINPGKGLKADIISYDELPKKMVRMFSIENVYDALIHAKQTFEPVPLKKRSIKESRKEDLISHIREQFNGDVVLEDVSGAFLNSLIMGYNFSVSELRKLPTCSKPEALDILKTAWKRESNHNEDKNFPKSNFSLFSVITFSYNNQQEAISFILTPGKGISASDEDHFDGDNLNRLYGVENVYKAIVDELEVCRKANGFSRLDEATNKKADLIQHIANQLKGRIEPHSIDIYGGRWLTLDAEEISPDLIVAVAKGSHKEFKSNLKHIYERDTFHTPYCSEYGPFEEFWKVFEKEGHTIYFYTDIYYEPGNTTSKETVLFYFEGGNLVTVQESVAHGLISGIKELYGDQNLLDAYVYKYTHDPYSLTEDADRQRMLLNHITKKLEGEWKIGVLHVSGLFTDIIPTSYLTKDLLMKFLDKGDGELKRSIHELWKKFTERRRRVAYGTFDDFWEIFESRGCTIDFDRVLRGERADPLYFEYKPKKGFTNVFGEDQSIRKLANTYSPLNVYRAILDLVE